MNKFSITRRYTPAKPRAASLQGSGVVTVNFSTSVTESLGTSQEIASTVVNNYYEGEASNYRGRITISNLLAIPAADISNNDLYLVYSEGSDGSGWSIGGEFTYEGKTYPDGTFFQFINGAWAAVDADEVDLSNTVKMSEMKEEMWLVESTFNNTSYWNLYGESKTGMAIATIGRYRLNADGVYEPYNEVKGTPGAAYYSENYTKTLYVPYARSYQSGGETVYQGGMLTAADYERLMQGGGGSEVTIDTSLPSNPSDTHVPSTKLFKATLASYPLKSELSAVATSGNYSDLNGLPTIPTDYAVVRTLANGTNLNAVKDPGFYNALGNHNCVNAHSTVNPFGLQVIHTAATEYYTQIIYDYWGKVYRRFGKSGTWSAWKECVADWNETDPYSPAFIKNKPDVSRLAPKMDFVRFEQSGQYAKYTFTTLANRGVTLSSRTSSTSGTNNLRICVNVAGLTTIVQYNDYLITHRVSVTFCGRDNSDNVLQMDCLQNVSVAQIEADVFFIIQLASGKTFDPSAQPNTFNVVFVPIE